MNSTVSRFILVGFINTAIDATIFVILRAAGVPLVIANICSTTVALLISFFLNYRFTFKAQSMTNQRKLMYVLVTLLGLWVLQPVVIKLLLAANQHVNITRILTDHLHHVSSINNLLAKLGATVVTLVWNYLWYSRVIFPEPDRSTR